MDINTGFALVGGVLLVIGVFLFVRTRSFLERAALAQGTVKGFHASSGSEGGTTYQPIVEFAVANGTTREFTDEMASNPPGFEVGETVAVKYDPKKPDDARLSKGLRLWYAPGFLSAMGISFLALGLLGILD